ncbi:MAG: MotA/TolQ/ExbB proton channel family protein [Planctomycetaceae bacterium]|nr:MotA/TolQ/ExbB proton channel family protein [Planctomycetaceae bacterium]
MKPAAAIGAAIAALTLSSVARAADAPGPAMRSLDIRALLDAGGTIGWIIMAMSLWMVALIVQHLLTVRRGALMPRGLAEEVHRLISEGHYKEAVETCHARPSFEAYLLSAGLAEVALGYSAVEKAMEDASQQQAARLFRRLEYFTVIGTIAPMLGLLGTVWGMILAFMEFESKANPSVSELAPGIYRALVTTLQGLCVAIPALGAYAVLRNRVDELVAEATLLAEYVFSSFKRKTALRRQQARKSKPASPGQTAGKPAETPREPAR